MLPHFYRLVEALDSKPITALTAVIQEVNPGCSKQDRKKQLGSLQRAPLRTNCGA